MVYAYMYIFFFISFASN